MALVIDLAANPGSAPGATGPYAGPLAYLARYGAAEAVQTLRDEARLLTEQLLRDGIAVLAGTGSWTGSPSGDEQTAALGAAERLRDALVMATNFMDGYLRAAVTLPLSADDANAGTLRDCCLALTRTALADDENATERMDTTAATWRKWLLDVSRGVVQLVGSTGATPARSARVRSGQAASGFDWGSFGSMP